VADGVSIGHALAVTDRILVTYRIAEGDPREVAEAIRVEQTIEFPPDLAPEWIRDEVIGQVETIEGACVTISYDPATAGGGLVQLLNLVWGNVSMFQGVRVTGVELPASVLSGFRGPRFGIPGVRRTCQAERRPLLTTALKPMGMSAAELAERGAALARAGLDIIKDDHGLANQPWAPWADRVARVAPAITQAAAASGTHSIYMPSLNVAADRLVEAAHFAKSHGAGALLVLPGLLGLDAMRTLADDDTLALPLMSHPSFLGSYVVNPAQGVDHGIMFGTLMRIAGADISVFPNHGGRFTFSPAACQDISERCRASLGSLAPIFPSPGGGMTMDRIPELLDFYGPDVALLIGGALHRGDLDRNARAMVEQVRTSG